MEHNYIIIGKRLPRKEDSLKATGSAKYASDISMPGMLHGKILRSPYAHARILNIDTSRAERLPGVKKVVTGKDTLGVKYGILVIAPKSQDEEGIVTEKVRYIGDEVAAVAAVDKDTAEEALSLIDVEYEELPGVFTPEEAMRPGAPNIHDHVKNNISIAIKSEYGEIERAFQHSDFIREDEFITQPVDHAPMEAHVAMAHYDASKKLTLWATTQTPYFVHKHLQRTLGLMESQVRVIKPYIGGGFGETSDGMSHSDFCAALLSIKTGKPVRIKYTREEEFSVGRRRHPIKFILKTGLNKDGTINVMHVKGILDTGAYNSFGTISVALPLINLKAYRIPNIKYDSTLVYTNNQPSGAMRGHTAPQTFFAVDQHLDLIAQDMGIDPIEIRVKNATQKGDVTPTKANIRSCGFTKCLNRVKESTGWGKDREDMRNNGKGLGVGTMSFVSGATNNFFATSSSRSSATLRVLDDGTVTLLTGASDIGQGSDETLSQIAAEELGVRLEDMRITSADTELTPVDFGSYSSRVTMFAGNAVKLAAADAKRQLFEVVAEKLEANPDDLEVRDRRIYVKGSPERGMTFIEAVAATQYAHKGRPIIGTGNFEPPRILNLRKSEGDLTPAYSFGAYVADVEIDRETGRLKVNNFTCAHDCGTAINPMRVEGQVEGSIHMGLGYVLGEELVLDKGLVLNPSFLDYKIPTAMETPSIKAFDEPDIDPIGPFGAKEAGEGPIAPVAGAIANAVYDAVGVRIRELPITPEKILKALEQKKQISTGSGYNFERVAA
ncbi:4-hydroxybenzoyl-CoA reductase subunit alpha [uncultured Desulfobacterium sp.]|uniref:4-hydroxybenzoyl-CoA reductase subunit alpha n=1 Tax=uncultured Desulfobacterium sp. TaxID=201089 RepID=A0A445MQZ2_9BACT|nr:4-hydroxybenzoyl-CoA reductase subunit alpha [uncultured Desulfobacterium sp.]